MGLHQAGFEVVGVDIAPQPKYPFTFIRADALNFPLDGFDFIWASPPCQKHTKAKNLQGNNHPCYIEEIRARLWGANKPYCIENVPGAPLLNPTLLCGTMFGINTYRHRLFETNFPVTAPTHGKHIVKQIKMGRPVKEGEFIQIVGNFSNVSYARKVMGIDWLGQNELREAIPPVYSKYIAEAWLNSNDIEVPI